MDLERANKIRILLNVRDELLSDLAEYEKCDSITGHINRNNNGLGFRWDRGDRELQYLIEGAKKHIREIESSILNFQMEGGADNG